ncbi:MAG TPA: hypothetical protein PLQ08_03615 [Bacteroidales bacterium]|nr:hypothetical protein [Bacteroidales bacterium]
MKKFLLFSLLQLAFTVLFYYEANSQGVAINNLGTNPDASAMLDVSSTNSGVLIPRMTQAQRDAISNPATGLVIYQTNNNPGFYYYDGSNWVRLSVQGESLTGNGTATRIAFWNGTNSLSSNANLYWDNTNSRLGVGTATPAHTIDVAFNGTNRVARFRNTANSANAHGVLISTTRTANDAYILNLDANGSSRMYVRSDGNVGLGTTSPAAQLHTTGTVRFGNYTSGIYGAFLRTNNTGDLSITNFTGNASDVLLGNGSFEPVNNLAWRTTGNSGTDPNINFIGTTDNQDFVIKTNNTEVIRISNYQRFYFNSPVSDDIDFRIRGRSSLQAADDYILKVEESNGDLAFCVIKTGGVGVGTIPYTSFGDTIKFHVEGRIRFNTYSSGPNNAILGTNSLGVLAVTNFTGNINDVLRGDGTFGTPVTSGTAWQLTGNSGTVAGTNFIGTTDNVSLDIRTNNSISFRVTNTGLLLAYNDGTAAAPVYSFNSNTTMGMYRSGANQLSFSTNSTERLRITSSGQVMVGYGTAATDAFQVSGYGLTNPRIFMGASGGAPGYGVIRMLGTDGTDNIVLRGSAMSYFNTGNQYLFGTNTQIGASDLISALANSTYTDPLNAYTNVNGAVGIYGQSIGTNGTGIIGYAPTGDLAIGVFGASSTGTGVYGYTDGAQGWSVAGEATYAPGTAGYFANTASNDGSSQGFALDARNNQTAGATIKANLGGTGNDYYSNTSISAFTDASINNGKGLIAACNNATGVGVQGQSSGTNSIGILGTSSGTGQSIGVYGQNTGSGANSYAVYGYRNNNVSGNGYGINNTRIAVVGYNFWGNAYNFGVGGYANNHANRHGGVIGGSSTDNPPSSWGVLGYRNSGGTYNGVYGSTAYDSGGGKSNNNVWNGVGVAGFGSLFGSVFRGQIYGMALKGERYAIYVDGKQITNNVITQVQDVPQSETRIATYVPTSTSVDILDRGVAKMTNGKITIKFKKEFSELVSEEEPIIVTVSPMGRPAVLYLQQVSATEFTVIDDSQDSQKDLTFSWIAVGVRKGYENPIIPEEILSKEFDSRLDTYLHNDSDTQNDGTPMWWDGSQLRFDTPPDTETEIKETDNNLKSINSGKVEVNAAEIKSLPEEIIVISSELKTTTTTKSSGINNTGKELIQRKFVNLSTEVDEK